MNFVENQLDPQTATIQGRALFENPDMALLPGMFGRIRLQGSGAYTAVLIPDKAVVSDQSQKFVNVVKPDGSVDIERSSSGRSSMACASCAAGFRPERSSSPAASSGSSPG